MRQAVVIIHGIGEQVPMNTLRGFIDSLMQFEKRSKKRKGKGYWSKPDRVSESYELRRFTAEQSHKRPVTDFFELYWAHNMRDTTIGHIIPWFKSLLLKWPPTRLLYVWLLSWVLVLLGLYFIISGVDQSLSIFKDNKMLYSLLGLLGTFLMQTVIIKYFGDAARYLTPNPENIAERHNIRRQGIDLLRNLHNSKRDYDRIVLVGHSLGSVIGYDIIKHLWIEFNEMHGKPSSFKQPALKAMEKYATNIKTMAGDNNQKCLTDFQMHHFRKLQRHLWKEYRQLGNPWLITDFITCGSPLAHASLLMSRSSNDLVDRQEDRELPTCPPVAEGKSDVHPNGRYYSYKKRYKLENGQKRSIKVLHHAAPFACTRWTNLYFGGDIIGGPLQPAFGQGIEDIKVSLTGFTPMNWLPTTHTQYWRNKIKRQLQDYTQYKAIKELHRALDLDAKEWLYH